MLILEGHTSPVYALAFSPDSYWLASGGKDGGLRLWDPAGAELPRGGQLADYGVNAVDFSSDGQLIGIATTRGWFLDDVTGNKFPDMSWRGIWGSVIGIRFLNADLVVTGWGDRTTHGAGSITLRTVIENLDREPSFTEPHGVRSVAAHPPSRTVAWSNGSRRVTVWDIVKPDPVHFNLKHNSPSVAFHPDGTRIAAAQEWGVIILDVPGRREVATLQGHKGKVACVAFSPDGRTLATGSWDGTVRLWETQTWTERQAFAWPVGRVYAVAFAPDGTRIAAAGDKGTIAVWDSE